MKKLQAAMVQEGRVKELADDLKAMADADFMKKYGKAKAAIRADMKRVDEARTDYTPDEMADMLSGKRSQKQIDADAERTRGPNKAPTTKESTQSRTKRLNEKMSTGDTLAAGTGISRLGKKDMEPKLDFRTGLDVGDDESEFFEPDVRIGKPVEPDKADTDAFMSAVDSYGEQNPYMQSWGGKYATGGSSQPQWRYVEKGEDPARYGSGEPAAVTSALPNLTYDPQSRTLKSADAPALDMSPKSKFKFDRTTQSQMPAAAAKQKMDWKTIYALNKATIGSNPNLIRPGMKLNMPDGSTYRVQPGDNLSKIAAKQSQVNEQAAMPPDQAARLAPYLQKGADGSQYYNLPTTNPGETGATMGQTNISPAALAQIKSPQGQQGIIQQLLAMTEPKNAVPQATTTATDVSGQYSGGLEELSTNQLARYKTAAAKDAKEADKEGDVKRGDKRFSGIVKATKKQFDNDAKKVDESRAARRALMAKIVNHR
jgi:LysM repeat protein